MTAYDDVFSYLISTRTVDSWDAAAALLAKLRSAVLADVADWLEPAGEPAAAGLLRKWGVPDPGLNTSGTDWGAAFIPHGDQQYRVLISEARSTAEERVAEMRDLKFEAWLVARQWRDDEPSPWVGFDLAGVEATAGSGQ